MNTERITPAELAAVRERHTDIEQEPLTDAPLYCRFLGTETCRMGLNIAEHNLTPSGWQHPTVFDPRSGRPVWSDGDDA